MDARIVKSKGKERERNLCVYVCVCISVTCSVLKMLSLDEIKQGASLDM